MRKLYSQIRLHKIAYYKLLNNSKSYLDLLSDQIAFAEFRLQKVANCWVQTYSSLLNSSHYSDCRKVFFSGQNLPVCSAANSLFTLLHPP